MEKLTGKTSGLSESKNLQFVNLSRGKKSKMEVVLFRGTFHCQYMFLWSFWGQKKAILTRFFG